MKVAVAGVAGERREQAGCFTSAEQLMIFPRSRSQWMGDPPGAPDRIRRAANRSSSSRTTTSACTVRRCTLHQPSLALSQGENEPFRRNHIGGRMDSGRRNDDVDGWDVFEGAALGSLGRGGRHVYYYSVFPNR